ncbi:MAG: alpha-amylase family glycosyl hydrolase, partial [Oscillospiraceae bacterium]|nr:alpha-amylase family glycosyl hydrolase [Oscillospiraceae bacterium]
TGFEGVGWNSIYLNNHDQARQVSRFGDEGVYHDQSAKMLCTLNMTLKGTPYVYQGEELGMTNAGFTSIDQYRDIDTMNAYRQGIKEGRPPEKILAALGMTSRDNARTPMAWSSEPNLGFTEGTPWLGYGKNADKYNAQTEEADPQSVLHYYREMIRLRKEMPVLVYGKFTMLDGGELGMAYIRELDGEKVMVLLNFSGEEIALPAGIPPLGDKLIGNYDGLKNGILRPYEAAMCYVK